MLLIQQFVLPVDGLSYGTCLSVIQRIGKDSLTADMHYNGIRDHQLRIEQTTEQGVRRRFYFHQNEGVCYYVNFETVYVVPKVYTVGILTLWVLFMIDRSTPPPRSGFHPSDEFSSLKFPIRRICAGGFLELTVYKSDQKYHLKHARIIRNLTFQTNTKSV